MSDDKQAEIRTDIGTTARYVEIGAEAKRKAVNQVQDIGMGWGK